MRTLQLTGTAAIAVTLMACYGDVSDYDCYDDNSCYEDTSCYEDDDCDTGYVCNSFYNTCEWSGECSEDDDCDTGTICDDRDTCVIGERPPDPVEPGFCDGAVTCQDAAPECAEGSKPGILNDCYTGECIVDADCTSFCSAIDNATACDSEASCDTVFHGVNCTNPDGGACTEPGVPCTCESFEFDECVPLPEPTPPPVP